MSKSELSKSPDGERASSVKNQLHNFIRQSNIDVDQLSAALSNRSAAKSVQKSRKSSIAGRRYTSQARAISAYSSRSPPAERDPRAA